MILDEWAQQWGIAAAAIAELKLRMGVTCASQTAATGGSESRVQSAVRLEAGRLGIWLTRNNVGVLLDINGRPVRYGLANESKAQNEVIKSGDLIGIRPVLITSEHMGKTIGQFVSREVKREGWRYKGDAHEKAQLRWAEFVVGNGGDAAFCSGPGSFNN